MTIRAILLFILISTVTVAQAPVDLSNFNKKSGARAVVSANSLQINWPTGSNEEGKIILNLERAHPLIASMQLRKGNQWKTVASDLSPVFILTVGKRDLTRPEGWNIFFDKTGFLPSDAYRLSVENNGVAVATKGSRTIIYVSDAVAGPFTGSLEITLYHGSPLLNIAAVVSTTRDSTAIIYDAGLASKHQVFEELFWSDTEGYLQSSHASDVEANTNVAVKYRTIIGETRGGSVAVFPPPHQYFYPLDNAYNLKHTWYGRGYRGLVDEFALGIRQDLMGDRRYVPWFNAPPGTNQRINFFCLLSTDKDGQVMDEVKQFTHNDSYKPLSGFKTMVSHFHTEHIDDVLTHKPIPEIPGHVRALRSLGVNIMHLGEFHLAGSPRDTGPLRLSEYKLMFEECARLSKGDFLMLPGEEPNSHFGGHWMNIFPKPVYWIMSRQPHQPFVSEDSIYGKVYRVGNKEEMLKLLEIEKGLAWTAHARTKGSTGYPDKYKDEAFFHSDRFLGAAWKAIPADLSQPRLGKRVLDLMDDMANWGHKKYAIAEADLFKLEPHYEIYGHLNVNYLELDELPKFQDGWQVVLDAMEHGKFFASTGEVLIPQFTVNGKKTGESLRLSGRANAVVTLDIDWTFPLNFVEIISGDGTNVYRQHISLEDTQAFGRKTFTFDADLKAKKWVRAEVWDVAANGAFTQFIWIE